LRVLYAGDVAMNGYCMAKINANAPSDASNGCDNSEVMPAEI
jgi:hypothetical protein